MSARPRRPFLLVGLTGGIATGKSTVTEIFRRLGCVIIDADVLAREVVEPGEPALTRIVEAFGRGVLRPDGTLDRKALGAIVFGDADKRRRLEAITHPEIRARLDQRLAELAARGFAGIVVFDAPVMIESGNYRTMDRLVVVVTDEATQAARLIARDGLTREEAARRITSQMPVAEKAKLADYVIDNRGARAATEAKAHKVWRAVSDELDVSKRLTGCAVRLATLFPVNMGNRGQNLLSISETFRKLSNASDRVHFVAYHSRLSGNFAFVEGTSETLHEAREVGTRITGLRCVVRRFSELSVVDWAVPSDAMLSRQSVILKTPSGIRRVIAVFLSDSPPSGMLSTGSLRRDIEVLSWPSSRDALCLYDRPAGRGNKGDVGQVTDALLRKLKAHSLDGIYGTGRAMGVIRDVLAGRCLRTD